MLNYNSKNMYCISFVLLLLICVFLFVTADMANIIDYNKNSINSSTGRFYIINKESLNNSSIKFMFMNLKSTYLELMQIGDIYETNSDNINITQTNDFDNEDNNTELNYKQNLENNKWRIIIPKINVDAPIKSGTSQEILSNSVGHFKESKYWNGNVALAGHNRGYNCNYFEKLKYLDKGDKIFYSTENGIREYKVVLNKIIKQTDWSYIENTEDNRITLITCVENMYEYRRCVQAVEI